MTTAAQRWRDDLAAWAIPDEILAQAPVSPWGFPIEMFLAPDEVSDSPSDRRAREALSAAGSVLDVGSGGGRASRALIPPAALVVAVDQQPDMLERFAQMAQRCGAAHREICGTWPAVADQAPRADVVVCHHVAYNVADLGPFLQALAAHARRRVVLEVSSRHPLSEMTPLWKRFWDLDRPTRPSASDIVEVAREVGIAATIEEWVEPPGARPAFTAEQQAGFATTRLCLPAEREAEVADALAELARPQPRTVATIWWDAATP